MASTELFLTSKINPEYYKKFTGCCSFYSLLFVEKKKQIKLTNSFHKITKIFLNTKKLHLSHK